MKRFFTVCLMFLASGIMAQQKVVVEEGAEIVEGVTRNSLSVSIEGANTEEIKKAWKKQLKDMKGKVTDKLMIIGDDCELKSVGDSTFDVYSVVEEATSQGVRVVAAFDFGGAYLSSENDPDRYPYIEKMMRDFAVAQAKEAVSAEIDAAKKTLDGYEKDLSRLEKDKEKLEKDIKGYEKDIEDAKAEIEKSKIDQASKKDEIKRMKASQLDGSIDEVQKVIKGFEKDVEGMEKDQKKLEKEIVDSNAKIKTANEDIEKNLSEQRAKSQEIVDSKAAIAQLEVKLIDIR